MSKFLFQQMLLVNGKANSPTQAIKFYTVQLHIPGALAQIFMDRSALRFLGLITFKSVNSSTVPARIAHEREVLRAKKGIR